MAVGVEPRAAVQDTSPITKGETRQVNHPAVQDRTIKTKGLRISAKLCKLSKRDHKLSPYFEFKRNSALNEEGNSNKFACWPNKAVQRELGLGYSGSLGTAVQGFQLPLISHPVQVSAPSQLQMSLEQQDLVSTEIQTMVEKQAITVIQLDQRGFVF